MKRRCTYAVVPSLGIASAVCPDAEAYFLASWSYRKLEGDRVASSRYDVSYDMENLFVSPRVGCDILDGR